MDRDLRVEFPHVLEGLDGVRSHRGYYMAKCPAHDDRTPSLMVRAGDRGLILKCYAGCTFEQIAAALGLDQGMFFYDHNAEPIMWKNTVYYDYLDEDGTCLYQNIREEGWRDGRVVKRFSQRAWRPEDRSWVYCMDGVRRVPYNLPEITENKSAVVMMVEGEKCANAVNSSRETNAVIGSTVQKMSSSRIRDALEGALSNRSVIVIPDNDEAGVSHAMAVVSALFGVAKSIIYVSVDDMPYKEAGDDIYDVIDRSGWQAVLEAVCKSTRYSRV